MYIEYPKAVYNSKNKATCTVTSKENEEIVKSYFKDEFDKTCMPYTKIPEPEALRLYGEVEKAVQDEKKAEEPPKVEEAKPEKPQLEKLRSLTYIDLVRYAKQVMKETGAKFPVRASRESIEKSIREVFNVDNNQ